MKGFLVFFIMGAVFSLIYCGGNSESTYKDSMKRAGGRSSTDKPNEKPDSSKCNRVDISKAVIEKYLKDKYLKTKFDEVLWAMFSESVTIDNKPTEHVGASFVRIEDTARTYMIGSFFIEPNKCTVLGYGFNEALEKIPDAVDSNCHYQKQIY